MQIITTVAPPNIRENKPARPFTQARQDKYTALNMRAVLAARFPNCFAPFWCEKRPVKIGIKKDIAARAPQLIRRKVELALADYCGGFRYLLGMVAGAPRYDLDGNEAGTVSEAHAAEAARILARDFDSAGRRLSTLAAVAQQEAI